MDPHSPFERLRAERRWIRLRELGWGLIGAWQLLSLASEFVPLDLESRVMRIAGKTAGFAGLLLVAYGFERLMRLTRPQAKAPRAGHPA